MPGMCRHSVTESCHSINALVGLTTIFQAVGAARTGFTLQHSLFSNIPDKDGDFLIARDDIAKMQIQSPQASSWHRLPCACSHTFALIPGSNLYLQSAVWITSEHSFAVAHRFPLYIQSTVWITNEGSFARPHRFPLSMLIRRLIVACLAQCASVPCL